MTVRFLAWVTEKVVSKGTQWSKHGWWTLWVWAHQMKDLRGDAKYTLGHLVGTTVEQSEVYLSIWQLLNDWYFKACKGPSAPKTHPGSDQLFRCTDLLRKMTNENWLLGSHSKRMTDLTKNTFSVIISMKAWLEWVLETIREGELEAVGTDSSSKNFASNG